MTNEASLSDAPIGLFDLVEVGHNRFLGGIEKGPSVLFGGQVIAQGLLAASQSEHAGRLMHSLHANFVRAGDATIPVSYEVVDIFEGRSFATRRVTADQQGRTLLTMTASFHVPEDGAAAHQRGSSTPGSPEAAKEAFEAWRAKRRQDGDADLAEHFDGRPIQIVPTDPDAVFTRKVGEPKTASWIRSRLPLRDPVWRRAALAYASDLMLLRVSMLPHGFRPGMPGVHSASLDHALWIFGEPDLTDWILFETESDWAGNGRSLNRGCFFDRRGVLIGEVVQESLIRFSDANG